MCLFWMETFHSTFFCFVLHVCELLLLLWMSQSIETNMDYKKDTFGIDLGDNFEINLFEISKNRMEYLSE